MNPLQQQRFNTGIGGLCLGLGVVAWAIALFFAVVPNAEAPAPVNAAPVVELNSCRATLSELGFVANVRNKADIVVFEPMGSDSLKQLERASLAATICKLPLHKFCLGEGCEKPGLNMTLRREAAKRLDSATNPEPLKESSSPAAS